jgi:hypothetical protein
MGLGDLLSPDWLMTGLVALSALKFSVNLRPVKNGPVAQLNRAAAF